MGMEKLDRNTERRAGSQDLETRGKFLLLLILNCASPPRRIGRQSARRFAMSLFIEHIPIFRQTEWVITGEHG